jgi:hypothetical protein
MLPNLIEKVPGEFDGVILFCKTSRSCWTAFWGEEAAEGVKISL